MTSVFSLPPCYFAHWERCKVLQSACLYVCLWVCRCLSVCLSIRISRKQHVHISRNFLYMLSVAVALSFCDDNAIHYVLPVLWMTSCVQIQIQTRSLRRSELFNVARHDVPSTCAPGAKSAITDCLVLNLRQYIMLDAK